MDRCDRCQQRLVVKDGKPAPGHLPGCFYVNKRETYVVPRTPDLPELPVSGRAKRNASTTANESRKRVEALHTLAEFQRWLSKGGKIIEGPEVARQMLSPMKAKDYLRDSTVRALLGGERASKIKAAAELLST